MPQDKFATYDAAYVLGSLSPKDRHEYEQHLRECDSCATAVRELAGMPGLLSQVPPTMLPPGAELPGPPDDLLPRLLDRVRAERRRHRWAMIGTAVVAAIACLAVVLLIIFRPPLGDQPAPTPTMTMSPLVEAPIWAAVDLQEVSWGTKINMQCRYDRPNKSYDYFLIVVAKDGHEEQVGSWTAEGGKTATLQAATSRHVYDIASIEIRTKSGKTLLTVEPS